MAYTPSDDAELSLVLTCNYMYQAIVEMKNIHSDENRSELMSLFNTDDVTELEMQFFRMVRKLGYQEEDFEDDGKIAQYIESNK